MKKYYAIINGEATLNKGQGDGLCYFCECGFEEMYGTMAETPLASFKETSTLEDVQKAYDTSRDSAQDPDWQDYVETVELVSARDFWKAYPDEYAAKGIKIIKLL